MKLLGRFVLIIGPSGVGKSVILNTLRQKYPSIVFPRSATTRARRPGEGDDLYQFISEEEFTRRIDQGDFLEWAQVHHGARYGTLLSEIVPAIEQGRTVLREVDAQGFQSIRRHPLFMQGGAYPLTTIFILPESKEQLIEHITKRAPMSDAELQQRLQSMDHELNIASQTDVQIVNAEGKLEETLRKVEEVIEGRR